MLEDLYYENELNLEYRLTNIPNIATVKFQSTSYDLICKKSNIPAPKIGHNRVILLDHEYYACERVIGEESRMDLEYHDKIYQYNDNTLCFKKQKVYNDMFYDIFQTNAFRQSIININFIKCDEIDTTYGIEVKQRDCIDICEYDNKNAYINLSATIANILTKLYNISLVLHTSFKCRVRIPVEELNDVMTNLLHVSDMATKSLYRNQYLYLERGIFIKEFFKCDDLAKYSNEFFIFTDLIFISLNCSKARNFI